jgi:hypothetical protein
MQIRIDKIKDKMPRVRMNLIVLATKQIGSLVVLAYFLSMFIAPWFRGGFDWDYIQNVWSSWQALNVGMLALASSIIALNISRFNAEEQRQREFVAAKAFLPEALSELTVYFRSCAQVLIEAWPRVIEHENYRRGALVSLVPDTPNDYKEIFRDCIRHAEPEVGERLALILSKMQIHRARITGYADMFKPDSDLMPTLGNALNYFYDLAELQALVSKLFPYAREKEEFGSALPKVLDIEGAYQNFGMFEEDYTGLLDYTRRRLGA